MVGHANRRSCAPATAKASKRRRCYQLYSQYGNLDLDPEEAESWDAGIEQRLLNDKLALSATYFNRDTTNMIDFVSCFGVNIAAVPRATRWLLRQRAKDQGRRRRTRRCCATDGAAAFSANYTSMDVENTARGSANFGRSLPRRPNETANAQAELRVAARPDDDRRGSTRRPQLR